MNLGYDWITLRLALGGAFEGEDDAKVLKALGVTDVINCNDIDDPPYVKSTFRYLWPKPTKPDDDSPRTVAWFQEGGAFWLPRAMDPDAKYYVHCEWGISRSHAMMIYLLMKLGLRWGDALALSAKHRPPTVAGVRYIEEAKIAALMV